MKAIVTAILMISAGLLAEGEYRLFLPVAGSVETPVFFLDFSQFKYQAGSLKLKDSTGKELAFSLDRQYSPLREPGRFYYAQVNGYHSHLEAPVSEKKLSRLGYLSFKAEPGIREYVLSFEAGTEEIQAAPNPEVRCWWIELLRDPYLRKPFGAPDFFYENSARAEVMENGGWKLCKPGGTVSILPAAYQFTEQIRGRRVIQYYRTRMDGDTAIVASVPLTNASNSRWPVVTGYAGVKKDVISEVWQEGIQDARSESIWHTAGNRCKGSFWVVQPVTGQIFEIHVQSPPQEEVVQLRVVNSLLNLGDTLRVEILNLNRNVLQPMQFKMTSPDGRPGTVTGAREDCFSDGAELQIILKDRDGKTVAETSGYELLLDRFPAGEYAAEFTLYSRRREREIILQHTADLTLQDGPQW